MEYTLVKSNDPVLHNKVERFDFDNSAIDPIELAHILAQKMIEHDGWGLSANQLGLSYRAFAVTGDPIIVMFNPVIVDVSEEQILLEEGCLSFTKLIVKVKRPRHIKVRYTKPNGETVTEKFSDLSARIIQHEADHLDGITMLNKASPIHKQQALSKRKKLERI